VTVAPCRSATQPRKYPLPSSTPSSIGKVCLCLQAAQLAICQWGGGWMGVEWRICGGGAHVLFLNSTTVDQMPTNTPPPPPRRPPATLPPLATFVQSHLQANRGSAGRRHCGGVASRLLRIGVATQANITVAYSDTTTRRPACCGQRRVSNSWDFTFMMQVAQCRHAMMGWGWVEGGGGGVCVCVCHDPCAETGFGTGRSRSLCSTESARVHERMRKCRASVCNHVCKCLCVCRAQTRAITVPWRRDAHMLALDVVSAFA
jgi:hypothetical protein